MRKAFRTNAWYDELTVNGRTTQLLSQLPNSSKDKIDSYWLNMLGLLWCRGDDLTKAQVFVDMISEASSENNDEDIEQEESDIVQADDEHLFRALRSLFYLATIFTINLAIDSNSRTFKPDERLILVRYVYSGSSKL